MSFQDVGDFFNKRSASYIRLSKWASDEKLLLASMSMLEGINADIVVELGCGNGLLLNQLKQIRKRIGIDISVNMLLSCGIDDIQKVLADIHQLPIKSNSIDLVTCRQVLQYCQPFQVFSEVRRILEPDGYFHIVQLTDYDEIPNAWYEYWFGLRGVRGRSRLSRTRLLEYANDAEFIALREESCYLAVHHTWSDFFEKNHVAPERHNEVMDFFRNAASEVVQAYQLRVNNDGISYVRRFSLLLLGQGRVINV